MKKIGKNGKKYEKSKRQVWGISNQVVMVAIAGGW
jgi:hypothetical protein